MIYLKSGMFAFAILTSLNKKKYSLVRVSQIKKKNDVCVGRQPEKKLSTS